MTHVLTVPGLFGTNRAMLPMMGGELTTVGAPLPKRLEALGFGPVQQVTGVTYHNWMASLGMFTSWGELHGRDRLDAALHAVPDGEQIVVLTHSMGTFALWCWLRDKAATSEIDPDRIVFVSMAAAWNMKTLPYVANSRYRICDVTVQWDRYADYPNVPESPNYKRAVSNVNKGDSLFGASLHIKGYRTISLDTPSVQNRIGHVTYLFYETATVPLATVPRGQIETAYDRTYLGQQEVTE